MAVVAKKCYYSNTSKIILFDFYSRYAYEKETEQNVLREDARMKNEIDNLQVCSLRPYVDEFVFFHMIESMLDGKQKKIKSKTNAYSRCIVCKAPPRLLKLRTHPSFTDNIDKEALKLGISLMHGHQRFFCWATKACKHRDFELDRCTKAFKTKYKKRKLQMQRQFKKYMGLDVDFPMQDVVILLLE